MEMHEILSNLCNYDTRNPNGIVSCMSEEEIKEEGFTASAKADCYCDNCFYNRTQLAEYILELKSSNAL